MKSAGSNKQHADAALLELILESTGEGIVFVQSEKTIGYINQAGRCCAASGGMTLLYPSPN